MAKYYFLLHWYQKTKKNVISILLFTLLFLVSTYMFADLIAMSEDKLGLVIAKWIAIVLLLAVITFNVQQIFKAIPVAFQKSGDTEPADARRKKIVIKEHLISRTELIMKKYRDRT
jgi:hypothetical protein